jgi:hypothetical protein
MLQQFSQGMSFLRLATCHLSELAASLREAAAQSTAKSAASSGVLTEEPKNSPPRK